MHKMLKDLGRKGFELWGLVFSKRKYYALEIGLFSLMIWRFLTIKFMMLIGFDLEIFNN